jgi:hypothetical protein
MTDMTNAIEREVGINAAQELYVIASGDGYTALGFDVCLDHIERVVLELVGRGVLPGTYIDNELTAVKAQRGTVAAYDTLQNLLDRLHIVCDEQGERAVYALSPQLMGLEGHRVEVVTEYDERRRFIVGKSTGWAPIHLEVKRRDSSGGGAAEHEYKSVRDLGRVQR